MKKYFLYITILFLLSNCSGHKQEKLQGNWELYRININNEIKYLDKVEKKYLLSFLENIMSLTYDNSVWTYNIPTFKDEIWTDSKLDYGDKNLRIAKILEMTDDKLVLQFDIMNQIRYLDGGPTLYFKKLTTDEFLKTKF